MAVSPAPSAGAEQLWFSKGDWPKTKDRRAGKSRQLD
jgi:hypothetical protein